MMALEPKVAAGADEEEDSELRDLTRRLGVGAMLTLFSRDDQVRNFADAADVRRDDGVVWNVRRRHVEDLVPRNR